MWVHFKKRVANLTLPGDVFYEWGPGVKEGQDNRLRIL